MTDTAVVVDARGHRCPVPTLRLRKAMEERPGQKFFRLLATDPMARIDAPYLMSQLDGSVLSIEETPEGLAITVERRAAPKG